MSYALQRSVFRPSPNLVASAIANELAEDA